MFEIKDSGIGLTQQQQKLLFNSFMQVDESYVRKHEGTGLGLAICKRIVELWGGEIWLESALNQGSTFFFTFKAQKGGKEEPEVVGADTKTMIKTPKVLLAEDNEFNQEIAYEIFQELGIKIDIAQDGIKAVQLATTQLYDIVFMDIHMPEADGITATRLIRKRLNAEVLPIVAVTAYALNENKAMCLEAGMNSFISKPFLAKDIIHTLQQELPGFFKENEDSNLEGQISRVLDNKAEEIFIDKTHALQYFSTEDRLKNYLGKFNSAFDNRWEELQELKEQEKFDSLRSLAHSIKGEAGYLGMKQLHSACKEVQEGCFEAADLKLVEEMEKIFKNSFEDSKVLVQENKK